MEILNVAHPTRLGLGATTPNGGGVSTDDLDSTDDHHSA